MAFQVLINHCTTGIAIRGNEVFTTNRNGFVGVFDAGRGLEERKIGEGQLRNPVDLVLLGKNLYVTDAELNKVLCFNAADGAHNHDLEVDDDFKPQYIASDGHNKIYVTCSSHNKTLYVFQNGKGVPYNLSIPGDDDPLMALMAPFDVAVDANGRILVTYNSHHGGFIQVFSPDMDPITRFNLGGNAIPYRIATDEESRYFVTSFDGGRVYLHVYQLQNENFMETQQRIQLGNIMIDNLFCGIAMQNGRVYCGYDKPFVQSITY